MIQGFPGCCGARKIIGSKFTFNSIENSCNTFHGFMLFATARSLKDRQTLTEAGFTEICKQGSSCLMGKHSKPFKVKWPSS